MRNRLLTLTILAALAVPAMAQAADPAAMRTFMNSKEIMGLIDKAKADRKGDAPLVSESILSMAPYRVQLEYRPGTSPAALHEKNGELISLSTINTHRAHILEKMNLETTAQLIRYVVDNNLQESS